MSEYMVLHNTNGNKQVIILKNIACIEIYPDGTCNLYLCADVHINLDTQATDAIIEAMDVHIQEPEQ